jgi:hypothetical protein
MLSVLNRNDFSNTPTTASQPYANIFIYRKAQDNYSSSAAIVHISVSDILYMDLISQANELSNLQMNWNSEGAKSINPQSIEQCVTFLENLQNDSRFSKALPQIDAHPDGEASLVWQNKDVGVFIISFSMDNYITYGGYFVNSTAPTKGKIYANRFQEIFNIIERFQ